LKKTITYFLILIVILAVIGVGYLYLTYVSEQVGIFELKHLLILVGIANVGILLSVVIYKLMMKKKSDLDYEHMLNKIKEKTNSEETP
jgi:uncharacterized integral membrane protein